MFNSSATSTTATVKCLLGRGELPGQRAHVRMERLLPYSALDWLSEKRARDQANTGCPAHLHLIHGGLYDLREWEVSHPGGREWLEWTRGTDCTAAFEVHHIDAGRAEAILKRHFVRTADNPKGAAAYTWEKDGFYLSLKRAVLARFRALHHHQRQRQKQQTKTTAENTHSFDDRGLTIRCNSVSTCGSILTSSGSGGSSDSLQLSKSWGPTTATHAIAIFTLGMFIIGFVATLYTGSLLLAVMTGTILHAVVGIGHNFFHQRNSRWRYVFDLGAFSHRHWRVSHALSHHIFPNLGADIEASMVEPYVRFMRSSPSNHWLVYVWWHLFHLLAPLIEFVRNIWPLLVTRTEPLTWERLLCPAQMATLVYAWGPAQGLILWLGVHGTQLYLLVCASTPVHRSVYSWTEGCDSKVSPPAADFGAHTVLSTADYGGGGGACGACFDGSAMVVSSTEAATAATAIEETTDATTGPSGAAGSDSMLRERKRQQSQDDTIAAITNTASGWGAGFHLLQRTLMAALFDDHVIHHLFPTIDASKQHIVRDLFERHCQQHGIPYQCHNFASLLSGTFAALYRPSGTDAVYRSPAPTDTTAPVIN